MCLKGFVMQLPGFPRPDQIICGFAAKVDASLVFSVQKKKKNIIQIVCYLTDVLFKPPV